MSDQSSGPEQQRQDDSLFDNGPVTGHVLVKTCSRCNKTKDIKSFYKRNAGPGRRCRESVCKDCFIERARDCYNKNKEKKKKYQKERYYSCTRAKSIQDAIEWRKNHPEHSKKYFRERHLKCKYGLSRQEYDNLARAQNFKCAICGKDGVFDFGKDQLCVDHCHKTGKVRGLLCRLCNHGLGSFKDNEISLLAAAEYLRKFAKGGSR